MILYSNGCSRCGILKKKLDDKNIEYEIVNDMEIFKEKEFKSVPMLEVEGNIFDFGRAIQFINNTK